AQVAVATAVPPACPSRLSLLPTDPAPAGLYTLSLHDALPILRAAAVRRVFIEPLWDMARWKSPPPASGDTSRFSTLCPPADSPVMVTLSGSPPKEAMLSCTHSRARMVSRVPKLPESDSGSAPLVWTAGWKNQLSGPSRYCTTTTTTSEWLARVLPSYCFAVPKLFDPPCIQTYDFYCCSENRQQDSPDRTTEKVPVRR